MIQHPSGLNFTFDDSAAIDAHLYQTGTFTTDENGQVSGTFQSDDRTTDPLHVLDTDSRTATLSAFNGLPADGIWTLFVADCSVGATETLIDWSLTIETVPDPSVGSLCLAGLAAMVWPCSSERTPSGK